MKVEVHYQHSNTAAKILCDTGEEFTAESGSMIAMSPHFDMETTTHKKGKGNFLKSLKRVFGGESFFLNHYTARGQGEVWLSSTMPGDIKSVTLNGVGLVVQSGSYLASSSSVEVDVGWQGMKSLFSGESLFWLKAKGEGELVLNAFGSFYEIDVEDEYIVDTGHIIAFEETLNFEISKAGSSWLSSFLGGEGLVCRFKGKGKIWCQSHHLHGFGKSLTPHLTPKRR